MDYAKNLMLSSTTIEGTKVRNLQDEKLGSIKDIMIDVDQGQIVYAVLSVHEGFLNLDSKYFAIPWKALRFDTENEIALLDVSEERLENSPGFDRDNWPIAPQQDFINDVYSYYGYESYYTKRAGQNDLDREFAAESMVGTTAGRPVRDYDDGLDYDNERIGDTNPNSYENDRIGL